MHYIYATQAGAQADLDAVNTAYHASLAPDAVTTYWAELTECVEGWAFPIPPEQFSGLCAPDSVGGITILNAQSAT